jgi:outer membrane protein, adhesin transport system
VQYHWGAALKLVRLLTAIAVLACPMMVSAQTVPTVKGWDDGYAPPPDLSRSVAQVSAQPASRNTSQTPPPSSDSTGAYGLDVASDPVLGIANTAGSIDDFRTVVGEAIAKHPSLKEAEASSAEALAAKAEALSQRLPTIDASINHYQTIARDFSNDPQNVIERSRARSRTDGSLSVSQPLYDFGATGNRIASARLRVTASKAAIDDTANRIAVGVVASHYDVFAYRALLSLSNEFGLSQRNLRQSVELRIRQGVSAAGDIAQVDSYIGSADRRIAEYTRALASAEARYVELVGNVPVPNILRIPNPIENPLSKDMAQFMARTSPAVLNAEALADAAKREAKSTQAAMMPNISAGIDAGRYGIIETDRDYDIRARITIRQRILGGGQERTNQALARADAAVARADRVREEAARDAAIAWSDVNALQDELTALEVSYLASRRSRDVLLARFKVSRGTLFDVLAAEDNLFQSAAAYIRTLTQLDTARYVLLSKTGQLLPVLAISSAQDTAQK